jgi:hypothetical protein
LELSGRRSTHQIRTQMKAAAPPIMPRKAIWPSPNLDPMNIPKMPDATMPDTHKSAVLINVPIFIPSPFSAGLDYGLKATVGKGVDDPGCHGLASPPMRGRGMVALGRVVLSKRERVIMLQPWDKGIMGTTVRYPYEVRDSKDYFYDIADVKVQPDLLQLAEHILKNKEASFDPTQFVDRYEQAVLEVLKTKQEGMPAAKPQAEAPPRNVINLFDALRGSLGVEKKGEKAAKPTTAAKPGKKAAKRNPDQREMLLPITGAGKGKEAAKPADKRPATAPGHRKAG